MTMSERTITVRLTGPQYRALAYAIGMAEAELEGENAPGDSQKLATLNRAWDKIKEAWDRNEASTPRPRFSARELARRVREVLESPDYYEAKPHKAHRDIEAVRAVLDRMVPNAP